MLQEPFATVVQLPLPVAPLLQLPLTVTPWMGVSEASWTVTRIVAFQRLPLVVVDASKSPTWILPPVPGVEVGAGVDVGTGVEVGRVVGVGEGNPVAPA